MAIVNIALVKAWVGELDDGVLWARGGDSVVVAEDIAPGFAGDRAGVRKGDTLMSIDGQDMRNVADVTTTLHASDGTQGLMYVVKRAGAEVDLLVQLQPMPTVNGTLYYSLALIGILSIAVGTSVRLRRPNDPATLHFFWLSVAFFGVLAFTPAGRYSHLDYFFEWADAVAALLALRVRLSGTAEPVGQDRPRPRSHSSAVSAGPAARRGPRDARRRRPAWRGVVGRARAARAAGLRVPRRVSAGRSVAD